MAGGYHWPPRLMRWPSAVSVLTISRNDRPSPGRSRAPAITSAAAHRGPGRHHEGSPLSVLPIMLRLALHDRDPAAGYFGARRDVDVVAVELNEEVQQTVNPCGWRHADPPILDGRVLLAGLRWSGGQGWRPRYPRRLLFQISTVYSPRLPAARLCRTTRPTMTSRSAVRCSAACPRPAAHYPPRARPSAGPATAEDGHKTTHPRRPPLPQPPLPGPATPGGSARRSHRRAAAHRPPRAGRPRRPAAALPRLPRLPRPGPSSAGPQNQFR